MSFESGPAGSAGPSPRPHLRLTDPKAMRAMAHPTRLALLEALSLHEPLTATEAAEIVAESPTNCAFHLRTLAKYGFVEEAEGGAGRRRPWRRTHSGFTFGEEPEGGADPETRLAAEALSDVVTENWLHRIRQVNARRSSFPEEWRKVTTGAGAVRFMTQREAEEFKEELLAMLERFRDRNDDPLARPDGSIPMQLIHFMHPLDAVRPPEG